MRKLLLRASCAGSVLLALSQFAAAQGLTTDFETNPMIPKTNSAQPAGSTTSAPQDAQGNGAGQAQSNESQDAGQEGASSAQKVDAKRQTSVYPGEGTTINGMPVYVSALIKVGDRVQTGRAPAMITLGPATLDLGLNTLVEIQEPLMLSCGLIVVRSGTTAINDGTNTFSFTAGHTAYATSTTCGGALPESPGSVRTQEYKRFGKSGWGSPVSATEGLFDARVVDRPFVAVNGVMFGSSVATAELTQRCFKMKACTDVPSAFRSRAAMYGTGLPAAVGVAYLGYYLKKKGNRWWFVPAAVVTVGDAIVSTHAVHYLH